MVSEPLNGEDHASIRRAAQALSGRYLHSMTLNERMEGWAEFVTHVEDGFDTIWAWEFDNDITDRDWLHDAWPILTERVRLLRGPELDALDERFLAATAPVKGLDGLRTTTAGQAGWWHFRYPLLVTGDPDEELPSVWSPPPTHIG